jgi:hypothetical protein
MFKTQARHCVHAEHLCNLEARVPGDHHAFLVNQYWVREAELGDDPLEADELAMGMRACVPGIRTQ